jgi:preprotein translocase subunit SecF
MSVTTPGSPAADPAGEAPSRSWAARLYLGEAGVNIVDRRRRWFLVAAVIVLIALGGMVGRGFDLGMEFTGGNSFEIPVSAAGSLLEAEQAVADAGASVASAQQVGDAIYLVRTHELDAEQALAIEEQVAEEFGITSDDIGANLVSAAWGGHITQRALVALVVFIALVIGYLVLRFEARAAVSAVSGLMLDLVATAGIYALVGFEVTPATIIGLLTIMGFGLYDSVVVFDKIHENSQGITASATQTYGEAANLAVNQVMIRSINTSVVALLPVAGLLFIGAGVLGAGTLKDLGLVLFVGMAVSFYTSLFFAAPLLVELKSREPRFHAHTQRVLAKRAALAQREARKAGKPEPEEEEVPLVVNPDLADLAGAAPKVGAKPAHGRRGGRRRPSGARRR